MGMTKEQVCNAMWNLPRMSTHQDVMDLIDQLPPDPQIEKQQTELDLLRRANEALAGQVTHHALTISDQRRTIELKQEAIVGLMAENAKLRKQLDADTLVQIITDVRNANSQLQTELAAKTARIEELGRTCESMEKPVGTLTAEEAATQVLDIVSYVGCGMRRGRDNAGQHDLVRQRAADIIRQVAAPQSEFTVREMCELMPEGYDARCNPDGSGRVVDDVDQSAFAFDSIAELQERLISI